MNGIEIIENIDKDIRNREDKDMAMAFTNVIGMLNEFKRPTNLIL